MCCIAAMAQRGPWSAISRATWRLLVSVHLGELKTLIGPIRSLMLWLKESTWRRLSFIVENFNLVVKVHICNGVAHIFIAQICLSLKLRTIN